MQLGRTFMRVGTSKGYGTVFKGKQISGKERDGHWEFKLSNTLSLSSFLSERDPKDPTI